MEKKELKPKIRFKGFDCEWQTSTIRNISDEIIAGGDVDNAKLMRNGKYPVVANALSNEGIVGYYNDDYRIEAPAITITARGDIGYAKARKTNFTPIVRLISIKSKNNIFFLENAINRIKIKSESTGVPQLTVPAISNYDINITKDIDEQNKIGELFENVNEFISVNKERIEKWKNIRTSFISKMFPKPGSKVPELRFKGFSGEWEEYHLNDITDYYNGKSYEDNQNDNGKYELINLNSVSIEGGLKSSGKFLNYAEETLKKNDLVMILSDVGHGDLLGRAALIPVDNKYVLNQRVALLRINKRNVIPRYLYYFINVHQQYFKILGAGSSQLNIGKEVVESFRVLLPNIEEQKAIAQFLYNIDKNIECQQQKLEKLKQIKDSFLSKMFV